MNLQTGTRLGPYEILSPLGAGGMGEVYKGRDTRLDRSVAVKVLAEHLASAEVRQRFEREARAISSLSHPNICTLYDVGREGDTDFLVMELLEGESLAARLEKGPLPVGEVLRLGIQIADALEKAHGSGVVHRDLKPGNIMLTERGVKLLDFGLAKLHVASAQSSGATVLRQAATEAGTGPLTTEGTLLGTFQYMAPEQLEGREADAASDIFALGAVLYEMATGHKAFAGKSQASLIGSIMHSTPAPIFAVAPMTPPALDRVIATCLAKDPRDRWQTAHDVRLQLQWIAEGGSIVGLPAPVAARRRHRERLAWAIAAVAGLAAAGFAYGFVRRAIPQPPALAVMGEPRISPDGSTIAFFGVDAKGVAQIWLRPLAALEARPLAGTEGVTVNGRPFWSPDGRWLGYFLGRRLMKVPLDGGPAQKVCDSPYDGADGSWSDGGVILWDGSTNDPIARVDAGGGNAVVEQGGVGQGKKYQVGWPQFLAGSDRYLFMVFGGSAAENGLWLAELGGGTPRRLVDGLSRVELAPPDRLLWVRDGTLVAQRLDADSAKLVGDPVPVAEGLQVTAEGLADFSASRSGVLLYRSGGAVARSLAWVDAKGASLGGLEAVGDGGDPSLSPDGRWLAYDHIEGGNADIWLRDLKRGVSSRLTSDPKAEYAPLFTPDGRSVVFSRDEGEGWALVERGIDSGAERVVAPPANTQLAFALTPDGRQLVTAVRGTVGGAPNFDLFVLDLAAGGAAKPYAASAFNEAAPALSPDGRWLAYQSNETGRNEIYVQAFPVPGRKFQISTQGGIRPWWTAGGKELDYYVRSENRTMRVAVTTTPEFDAGVPEPGFPLSLSTEAARNLAVLSPDGERLLTVGGVGSGTATPTTVVLDWTAALQP